MPTSHRPHTMTQVSWLAWRKRETKRQRLRNFSWESMSNKSWYQCWYVVPMLRDRVPTNIVLFLKAWLFIKWHWDWRTKGAREALLEEKWTMVSNYKDNSRQHWVYMSCCKEDHDGCSVPRAILEWRVVEDLLLHWSVYVYCSLVSSMHTYIHGYIHNYACSLFSLVVVYDAVSRAVCCPPIGQEEVAMVFLSPGIAQGQI